MASKRWGSTSPTPDGKGIRARYRGPDGRQYGETFRVGTQKQNQKAADDYLATEYVKIRRSEWRDPTLGDTLVVDWIERWMSTTVHLRPSTQARDESYVNNHIVPRFGDLPLKQVEQLDVVAWVAELTRKGLRPSTVQKVFQIFSKIMAAAVPKMIPSNPCERVKLPKVERDEIRIITPAEIATLANTITPRYKAMILVGAYGGLRLSELAGLRRGRVDLLRGAVRVAENAVEVKGHIYLGPPKTRAGKRTVPLPKQVVAALDEHMSTYTEKGADAWVFSGPEGHVLRASLWRRRHWTPAVRAAGLIGMTPHGLRHTAVSLWCSAWATPNEVAARAGHSSVVTVLDRYGHLFADDTERTTAKLDEMFVAEPPPDAAVAHIDRSS